MRPWFRPTPILGAAMIGGLGSPFAFGGGGPGGWILPEPGIELPGPPEFSPDLAGWRRERMSTLPGDEAIKVVPDWACEILSPTTRRHNLLTKKPFYARIGVAHLWLVDLDARVVVASRLEQGRWVELGSYGDDAETRIEPFDAVPLDLRTWWEGPT